MSISHSLRSLRRTPGFALAATLTLALGIGAVGAAFAIGYGVLLSPLPYGRPDRLVSVGLDLRAGGVGRIQQPPAIYLTYKRFARRVSDIAFYRRGNANLSVSDGGAGPERVSAAWMTASAIPLLQVRPLLGRGFTADEERTGGNRAAVISESVWQTYFNGSRDVLGKTVLVNAIPRVIVGVMPREFRFPEADVRIWLPAIIDQDPSETGDFIYSGVARLAPGATVDEAQRDLKSVLPRVAELYPRLQAGSTTASWLEQTKPTPVVVSLRDEVTHGIARTLWMLVAAAGLVLLVALANVANLMLIRADARQLELAVREALGAGRLRVVTHFLGECMVLAGIAGGAALLLTATAVKALVAFGPTDVPRLAELHVDAATVAFVIAVSLAAAVICAVAPTLRLGRSILSINLRTAGRSGTAGKNQHRLRSTLVALQIAVALVVVAGSILLLRTFERLSKQPAGFDATNVTTIWTQLPFARYGDSSAVRFYARLAESVERLPGVEAAGLTSAIPLGRSDARQLTFRRADGRTFPTPIVAADSGYFSAMKIAVLAGRAPRTSLRHEEGIVLSKRAAELFFDDASGGVVGRSLSLAPTGPTYTVVGVVADVRDQDLGAPPSPTVYMAQTVPVDGAEPAARRSMALVVRASGSATIVGSVRRILRELDPAIPVFDVAPMTDVVRASTARLSLTLVLMSAAAVITLVLGMIGLYGVMTYMVGLRTRELGIRLALGADPGHLARGVALGGMVLLAGGVVAGLVLYAGATPFLRGFLYGVTVADPLALLGATGLLVVTAAVASWLPARRAARVDPTVAMRAE